MEQGLFPEKKLQLNKVDMIKAQALINKISIKEFNNQQPWSKISKFKPIN